MGSAVATYGLAALFSTQITMNEVARLGLEVSFGERISAAAHDVVGMATAYLPLVAVSLLIAFPVAALVLRFTPVSRTISYMLAGAAAMLALHLIMHGVFEVHPLPAARTALGLAMLTGAGAVGGYVFARLGNGARAS